MPFITVNETDFYYEIHGNGKPLFLIGGFTCQYDFFFPVVELLTKHYQVILLDNRGVGQTKDKGGVLSAKLMAQDIIEMIAALRVPKPHILGLSMGGTIALEIGIAHSDKVSKLVVVSSTAKWRPVMLSAQKALVLLRKQELDPALYIKLVMPWIFGDAFIADSQKVEQFREYLFGIPHPQSIKDLERQFEVLKTFDVRNQLGKITTETLIMHGNEDLFVTREETEKLAQAMPKSSLRSFKTGHSIPWEEPEQFSHEVVSFLS